jgi:pSer/pThr/pTyr-binding forkhead associated (FHA) protein
MSLSHGDGSLPKENSVPFGLNTQVPTGLADILQICCVGRQSGEITFHSGESSGYVYLEHGNVIHAVCGPLAGEAAVYQMLSWAPGVFTLAEDVVPTEITIDSSWEHLILEGARRADQGLEGVPLASSPVITAAPSTSRKVRANQPKITVLLENERPRVYELEAEYTHVGRASGNEIPLVDPSVSNRHCILIQRGPDVVLRDLNSSNGTLINGQPISEAILQPGDLIQVGIIQMKFEPAIKRPKLTQPLSVPANDRSTLTSTGGVAPFFGTVKLPSRPERPAPAEAVKSDSVFVKGESAISYDNLPKPELPPQQKPVVLIVVATIVILSVLAGGYYYFIFLHR